MRPFFDIAGERGVIRQAVCLVGETLDSMPHWILIVLLHLGSGGGQKEVIPEYIDARPDNTSKYRLKEHSSGTPLLMPPQRCVTFCF